ncbi:FAD dependent oxidoreductase [Trichoderma harzianum]|uniref:FAD dependent oxidoreductase n=1 Tax=Trichoderma harzianum TaxID=5544 RepID=A0A0F9XUN9_TRIHA|nr:FAD dependent oxidoreductase [Trichoderma harzianum]
MAANLPSSVLQGERNLNGLTLEGLQVGAAEGVVVQANAASLWPYKLVAFVLERLLVAGGFSLQTKTPVTGLERVDLLAGQSNSHPDADKAEFRGWTAHTSHGDISARHVLLATNAYTSRLPPQFADIIVPAKGQVSSLKPPLPPQPAKDPLDIGHTFYFVSDLTDRKDDYLAQRTPPGAELIYGGGCIHGEGHELGEWDESTIDESVGRYLKYEPSSLMDLSIRITGFSRDGWPWAGLVPESAGGGDGLWLCAGYSGGGMPNAVLCAKAVADMMINDHGEGGEGASQVDLPPRVSPYPGSTQEGESMRDHCRSRQEGSIHVGLGHSLKLGDFNRDWPVSQ